MLAADLGLAVLALTLALALRPWRMHPIDGPPAPVFVIAIVLPLLWSLDRVTAPMAQPLSGAPLLVLFAGWPWAMVSLVPAAAGAMLLGHLDAVEALHRLVWLGVVPATLAMLLGALLRRTLPMHLFLYVLGRGFLGTIVACALARGAEAGLHALAGGAVGADLLLAGLLNAFAEGTLTGMLVAIAVAYRPAWLATYSDRLYLPPRR